MEIERVAAMQALSIECTESIIHIIIKFQIHIFCCDYAERDICTFRFQNQVELSHWTQVNCHLNSSQTALLK